MIDRKQMIRFCIAGAIVTSTDCGIYYVLFHFFSFSISKGISFTLAGIVGYFFDKYWTFKRKESSYTEIGRYTLINFIALGMNILINQHILSSWSGSVWTALIIATTLTSLFTFVCFKWWVFRSPIKEKEFILCGVRLSSINSTKS